MITKPETLAQAAEWERTKNRYLGHGLCQRCAAQAAWAHQNLGDSWTTIHPPCELCAQIVAEFPCTTPSPDWRKTLRRRAGATVLDEVA
jgi:hypothetical protein